MIVAGDTFSGARWGRAVVVTDALRVGVPVADLAGAAGVPGPDASLVADGHGPVTEGPPPEAEPPAGGPPKVGGVRPSAVAEGDAFGDAVGRAEPETPGLAAAKVPAPVPVEGTDAAPRAAAPWRPGDPPESARVSSVAAATAAATAMAAAALAWRCLEGRHHGRGGSIGSGKPLLPNRTVRPATLARYATAPGVLLLASLSTRARRRVGSAAAGSAASGARPSCSAGASSRRRRSAHT